MLVGSTIYYFLLTALVTGWTSWVLRHKKHSNQWAGYFISVKGAKWKHTAALETHHDGQQAKNIPNGFRNIIVNFNKWISAAKPGTKQSLVSR